MYIQKYLPKILFAKAANKGHLLTVLTNNYNPGNFQKDFKNFSKSYSIIQLNVLVFALFSNGNDIFLPKVSRITLLN